MDIKYKMFPYPVLGELYNDYKNSKILDDIHYQKVGKEIIFKLRCYTDNIELRQLITQQKASYTFHIECPQTSYRNIVKTNKEESNFTVTSLAAVTLNVMLLPVASPIQFCEPSAPFSTTLSVRPDAG